MPIRVGIIGCGVVGAAIAYHLSQTSDIEVWAWDRRSPHHYAATGAALGVLMAVSSTKLKGRHLRWRLESLQQYETLVPQLEAQVHRDIPYNRQGVLRLCFDADALHRWHKTQAVRQRQGFQLELLTREQVTERFPRLQQAHLLDPLKDLQGAIYAPQDRQVDPVALTEALLLGAQQQGAQIQFEAEIQTWQEQVSQTGEYRLSHVCTPQGDLALDWLIVAAGLGSVPLAARCQHSVPMQPVLGQALRVRLPHPWPYPQPVISGDDVHLVPLSAWELWVGATLEFPVDEQVPIANPETMARLYEAAIALYPDLAQAQILKTWSGLRPRPVGQAAPVIQKLTPYTNVMVASGHYRNGVLLAPITATKVQQFLTS